MKNKLNIHLTPSKAKRKILLAFGFWLLTFNLKAQINYVINGGFEQLDSCTNYMQDPLYNPYIPINYASPWDTLQSGGGTLYTYVMNRCMNPNNYTGVPFNLSGGGYQQPHHGSGYSYSIYLKLTQNQAVNWRNYSQQKLRDTLTNGKVYCVTYWANLINYVNYAVDELAAYFDNGSLTIISPGHEAPANPQVKSPSGVFYGDTLNWMKVQGTFIANGTESYITIGNFRTTAATTYTSLDGQSAGIASYFIDDVSVIEADLPAYAGPDIFYIPGDSVYIGRQSEIGLDDDCSWYKLPNTTTPVDTVAGLWIKPIATCTYVVKQDICGNIKWDTVVVHESAVGLMPLSSAGEQGLRLYPNPANDILNIESGVFKEEKFKLRIFNNLNQLIREEDVIFDNKTVSIKTDELKNGIYFLSIKSNKYGAVSRKFVVAR